MSQSLGAIKSDLANHVGCEISVSQQTGRRRTTVRRGILTNLFPAVFIVELDQDENKFERACYSYTDVLTEAIDIQFTD